MSSSHALKQPPVPRAFGRALLLAARWRVARWDDALRRLERTQTRELVAICRRARDTEFGLRHQLGSVRGHRDFAARVAVRDYDAFAPSLERMRKGETNVLLPDFVRYYGHSSGSSVKGKNKFLPISDRQIRDQIGSGTDGLFRYLAFRGESDFTSGYTLGLFPPTKMRPEGPVLITSNPALMLVKRPWVSRLCFLPNDRECMETADYDRKIELIAERHLDHDVRAITGTTCWFSLLFDKLLAAAERRGRRARTIGEIWPNLTLFLGGGVSAKPYLPVIRERVGKRDVTLVDTYNATEGGVYAASDHSGEPGMLVIPDRGVFFEFVPAAQAGSASPRRLPLWEVERGPVYSVVVTTTSGLYAYEIGDLVRFTSLEPPRLEFVGRTMGCLSATQELATHNEIEQAVSGALAACGGMLVDFTASADIGVEGTARARYVLFIEPVQGVAAPDIGRFAAEFDAGMSRVNYVYREHRDKEVALLAPDVVVLPPGSVKRFMTEVRAGNVQSKFPRIVDDEWKELLRSYVRGGPPSPGSASPRATNPAAACLPSNEE